jgi:hypothetical protein
MRHFYEYLRRSNSPATVMKHTIKNMKRAGFDSPLLGFIYSSRIGCRESKLKATVIFINRFSQDALELYLLVCHISDCPGLSSSGTNFAPYLYG